LVLWKVAYIVLLNPKVKVKIEKIVWACLELQLGWPLGGWLQQKEASSLKSWLACNSSPLLIFHFQILN
jgi:hypothetical protein